VSERRDAGYPPEQRAGSERPGPPGRERAGVILERYGEVLGILREQVAALGRGDLARMTPCSEWDALALVAHVIGASEYYAQLAGGGENVRPVILELEQGDDLVARFDVAAANGVAAWAVPGALDREVRMVLGRMPGRAALSVHIGDLAVHAWDLAVTRGSTLELPDELALAALDTWEDVFVRLNRGTAFGDEVVVDDSVSPTVRLIAYCGRAP
jgi:uncharacterized protein (TIGR03086 family)